MWKRARNAFVVLLALGLVAVTGTVASARNFSVDERSFYMRWSLFRFQESGGSNAECPVTLEGSFHAWTMAKVRTVLVGFMDGATMGTCSLNSAGFLTSTLPWHIQYEAFTGALPSIGRLRLQINEAAIWIREGFFGSRCLAVARATELLKLEVRHELTGDWMTEVFPVESAIRFAAPCTTTTTLIPSRLRIGEMVSFINPPNRIRLTLI
jgi:hypothetical protein